MKTALERVILVSDFDPVDLNYFSGSSFPHLVVLFCATALFH